MLRSYARVFAAGALAVFGYTIFPENKHHLVEEIKSHEMKHIEPHPVLAQSEPEVHKIEPEITKHKKDQEEDD